MRLSNMMKVTCEMPVRYNEPDANGVVYTREAIVSAVKNKHNLPFELLTKDNVTINIGNVENFELVENEERTEGCIKCSGVIWNGGTCENVNIENNKVVDMEIKSIGIAVE